MVQVDFSVFSLGTEYFFFFIPAYSICASRKSRKIIITGVLLPTMPPSDECGNESREGSDWEKSWSNSPSKGPLSSIQSAIKKVRNRR